MAKKSKPTPRIDDTVTTVAAGPEQTRKPGKRSGSAKRNDDMSSPERNSSDMPVRRLEELLGISRDVLTSMELDELLQTVTDAARRLTRARLATCGHGYADGTFNVGASSLEIGLGPCPSGNIFRVNRGGVYLDLVRNVDSVRMTDSEIRNHPDWWGLPEDHAPLRGLLGAGLKGLDGTAVGLIMVSDKEDGGDFNAEDEFLLMQLAAVTSLALRQIEAREDINRHNAVLAGINSVFEKALSCETEEELGEKCLRVAEEITGSRIGFIAELGRDGLLHAIAISEAGWNACAMHNRTASRKPPGNFKIHGIFGRVLLDGKSFYTNDPASHPDSIGVPGGHPAINSFLGVPLITGGKTIGIIALGNRDGGCRDDELESLESLASAFVEALLRLRAEESLRRTNQRLDLLAWITAELLRSDSPQAVINILCEKVTDFLGCHAFFNFLPDKGTDRLRLNACAGISGEEVARHEWLDYGMVASGGPSRDACRIASLDMSRDSDSRTLLLRSCGIRTYACHPLAAKGRVLGTLSFRSRSSAGFSEEDVPHEGGGGPGRRRDRPQDYGGRSRPAQGGGRSGGSSLSSADCG